jgi:hypothetical protein
MATTMKSLMTSPANERNEYELATNFAITLWINN